jgi:predicted pyridoxine 5'-phosphate oxidase superfamily flavin-nucleotide-binding protein
MMSPPGDAGEPLATIDDDMRAVVAAQRLCFAATVTPDGRPNVSPKGTVRVWDDHHVFFCDIASPETRRNLAANPWIELNVVDPTSRRGYRFLGQATVHRGDEVYRRATAIIFGDEGTTYPVESVVLIAVTRALPLVSPGYWHVEDETAMRAMWRIRRAELDAEFEAHIERRGPYRRDEGS